MWWYLIVPAVVLAAPHLPIFDPTPEVSPVFVEATKKFSVAMNLSVDPCEDFFQFSCGNWIASHPIPSYLTSYNEFNVLREKVQDEMKALYDSKETSPSKAITNVKIIYHVCMGEEAIDKSGTRDVLTEMALMGYFPIVHGAKWELRRFDLTDLLIKVADARGIDIFFDASAGVDIKNVTRRILSFDQGILGLGQGTRDYYLDKIKFAKQINAYRNLLIKRVSLLTEDAGLPVNNDKITADVDAVLEFETRFAEILVPEDERRNYSALYHSRQLFDLNTMLPLLDWKKYFLSITPYSIHHYINSNPEIVVTEPEYFDRLTGLLNSSSPEVITNYIFFRYISQFNLELGSKYEQIEQDFSKAMYGRKQQPPRWKDCINAANGKMSYASGAMYVRKHFDKESKTATLDMITDLQSVFLDMLKENVWMDEETKKYAELKANEMNKLIGYPDFLLMDEKLDEWYKDLELLPTDSYTQINTKLIKFFSDFHYKRLLEVVDRDEFSSNSATVNAFYSSIKNAIIFPAAILQPPFFNKEYPKGLNYGAIGAVIGHEITHGFDDQGRQFDAIGNLRSWWDDTTADNFKERAQCIIDQYGNITAPRVNVNINGKLTLGENIADIGGVKEAFRAYKRYLSKHGEEKRIPGFEQFDNHQMFFIGYAQNWCGHMTPEAEVRLLLTDPHSPGQYRVNVVLGNQPEFAEAFKCPAASPMNPDARCGVW